MAAQQSRRLSRRLTVELSDKKFFLLDMDGTIYLGDDLFDATVPFLEKIREKGGKYLFLTNNSSRGADEYVKKLARLGIPSTEDDFLTSTDATIVYIREHYPDTRFYTVGTPSFIRQLDAGGVLTTTDASDADVGGVLLSNDVTLTYSKIDDASRLLSTGDPVYIATNPDPVCPTAYGSVPDCGSFAAILQTATGKSPYFIGKPRPEMVTLAMEKFGYTKDETVVVGDRVFTDVAAGNNAGVDTVFVLSGEGTMSDPDRFGIKPTYIMKNVGELCSRL